MVEYRLINENNKFSFVVFFKNKIYKEIEMTKNEFEFSAQSLFRSMDSVKKRLKKKEFDKEFN